MALDDATKHALHLRFDELVGPELAGAMMTAYDPPVPWDELATKHDLAALEERMTLRMEAMLMREINRAITAQTRTVLIGVIGTVMATGGTILAGLALSP